jgi:hypothetical protein
MKHLKLFLMAAVAAAASVSVLGATTASATVLCKNGMTTEKCSEPYAAGMTFNLSLAPGSTLTKETLGGTILETCSGAVLKGKLANAGSSAETVRAQTESMTWTGCTKTTSSIVLGEFEFHRTAGTDNATLTWKNSQVTTGGIFGESCIYGGGAGTDLGTLVGGSPATLNVNAILSLVSGGGLCPKELRWTAGFQVTEPKPLFFSAA